MEIPLQVTIPSQTSIFSFLLPDVMNTVILEHGATTGRHLSMRASAMVHGEYVSILAAVPATTAIADMAVIAYVLSSSKIPSPSIFPKEENSYNGN